MATITGKGITEVQTTVLEKVVSISNTQKSLIRKKVERLVQVRTELLKLETEEELLRGELLGILEINNASILRTHNAELLKVSSTRRVIDPAKFFKKVSLKAFFASVTVAFKEAEKYLSGEDLGKITVVIESKPYIKVASFDPDSKKDPKKEDRPILYV